MPTKKNPAAAEVAATVRALRIARGWTQRQVAEQLGISQAVYSRYESGLRPISLEVLRQLADLFQIGLGRLVGESEEVNQNMTTNVSATPTASRKHLIRKELAERVRALRKARNLTQQQIAERLGISQAVYSRYELGLRAFPMDVLRQLASLFDVSMDHLVGTNKANALGGIAWSIVGAKAHRLREDRQWDLPALAQATGLNEEAIRQLEDGQPMGLDDLARLARVLGVGLSVLLDGARPAAGDLLDRPLRDLLPVRPVPILGRIVAGIPMEAQPDRIGEAWVDRAAAVDYALEVRGDSMVGAGVLPGDRVLVRRVERWEAVAAGAMVVALRNGGEATLKYLVREPGPEGQDRWWLRAANAAYPDLALDPEQDRVLGVVVGIQRQQPPPPWRPEQRAPPPGPPQAAEGVDLLAGLGPAARQAVLQLVAALRQEAGKGES